MDSSSNFDKKFMKRAIELAQTGSDNNLGGPFGSVIVHNGIIVGEAHNEVTSLNDPTAHAEVLAIRRACKHLNTFQLTGCEIYCSCEPCPMCLGAIYWARPSAIYYASQKSDAANAGFDDSFIYDEIAQKPGKRKIPSIHMPFNEAVEVFLNCERKKNRINY
jgi:tRNA(Arg) A34 adenosine deaminase TadA